MSLPNGTDTVRLEEALGQEVCAKKVKIEVGLLLALFSDLHYLLGSLEAMEEILKMQKELIKD